MTTTSLKVQNYQDSTTLFLMLAQLLSSSTVSPTSHEQHRRLDTGGIGKAYAYSGPTLSSRDRRHGQRKSDGAERGVHVHAHET